MTDNQCHMRWLLSDATIAFELADKPFEHPLSIKDVSQYAEEVYNAHKAWLCQHNRPTDKSTIINHIRRATIAASAYLPIIEGVGCLKKEEDLMREYGLSKVGTELDRIDDDDYVRHFYTMKVGGNTVTISAMRPNVWSVPKEMQQAEHIAHLRRAILDALRGIGI